MLSLPSSAYIHRRLPKEALYRNMKITGALKERFITDIDKIFIEHSITMKTLNLPCSSDIGEVLILSVQLRRRDFSPKIFEAIAKQNPHKLLFLLSYAGFTMPALYHSKMNLGQWQDAETFTLRTEGLSVSEVWENYAVQVALHDERARNTGAMTLDERLGLQEKILRLEAKVRVAEKASQKELQPKKIHELFTLRRKYMQELELLKEGKYQYE